MGGSIALQTSKKTDIANSQESIDRTLPLHRFQVDAIRRKFIGLVFRNNPSDIYNCHGLTFACRRTGIYEIPEVYKIIRDDRYEEIADKANLLPGDIILYYGEDGDIEHSGIIMRLENMGSPVPIILSKWGMFDEVIHSAFDSPYNKNGIKYYRCK